MSKRKIIIDSDAGKVSGILNHVGFDFIIILVHGFHSSKDNSIFEVIEKSLGMQGVSCLRIDLFGHGESDGQFSDLTVGKAIASVDSALDYARTHGYYKYGIMGSSFGALAAVFAASKHRDIACAILKSPILGDAGEIIAKHYKINCARWEIEKFFEWQDHRGRWRLNFSFYEDARKYDANTLFSVWRIPTLLFVGGKDKVIDIERCRSFAKNQWVSTRFLPEMEHAMNEQELLLFLNDLNSFIEAQK